MDRPLRALLLRAHFLAYEKRAPETTQNKCLLFLSLVLSLVLHSFFPSSFFLSFVRSFSTLVAPSLPPSFVLRSSFLGTGPGRAAGEQRPAGGHCAPRLGRDRREARQSRRGRGRGRGRLRSRRRCRQAAPARACLPSPALAPTVALLLFLSGLGPLILCRSSLLVAFVGAAVAVLGSDPGLGCGGGRVGASQRAPRPGLRSKSRSRGGGRGRCRNGGEGRGRS